ncbi:MULTISPECIES: YdcF family protein [unclassified Leptolyngbya]|uniref:YdcF family protein n=1 Tax=unclassified Leptolyngbya TaxID=2650499 RepID=UPI0016891AA5|nr:MULTISPECIES: YdcF family protein [unclassified Leptolyngbya]MBD1911624.1 YdcF family protein [Leptolyngbya sp. FACHB-8]MBD2153189.1 YdcF family protein [Leptolyngbya sp. FACHB-16]
MMETLRRSIGGNWSSLNWGIYDLLISPRFVSLALLFAMALLVLGSYPALRRQILRGLIITLAVYWMVISPPVVALTEGLLMALVPPDTGESADAIVVLGRGAYERGDRYPVALQLLQDKRAPNLFITGRGNFQYVADALDDYGVSLAQVNGTYCGRTTKDEAYATSVLLGPHGIQKIILVSDRPHMLRAYLTFRGRGFTVIPHPIDLSRKISSARRSILTLREYFGLASYLFLGRLHPGSPEELRQPSAELVQEVRRRRCEIKPEDKPALFQASRSRDTL